MTYASFPAIPQTHFLRWHLSAAALCSYDALMMLCYSYNLCPARSTDLACLACFRVAVFSCYVISGFKTRQAFSFLFSSPSHPKFQQVSVKSVWRTSGLVLENRRGKLRFVVCLEKIKYKLESVTFACYFLPASFICLSMPEAITKNVHSFYFHNVVGK